MAEEKKTKTKAKPKAVKLPVLDERGKPVAVILTSMPTLSFPKEAVKA